MDLNNTQASPESTEKSPENHLKAGSGTGPDKPRNRKSLKEELISLGWIVLIVLSIRAFIIEPYKIPSASMVPTLLEGDHIFVSKYAYFVGIPFTKIKLFPTGTPRRGDVAVFLFPVDESVNFVKRIIGIPGDTLEVREGVVLVNDYPLVATEISPQDALKDARIKNKNAFQKLYWETFPHAEGFTEANTNFDMHYVLMDEANRNPLNQYFNKITVPPGHYFVMGDNRDKSLDSRSWGFVPQENLKGHASIIWWSIHPDMDWLDVLRKFRWDRSFTWVK